MFLSCLHSSPALICIFVFSFYLRGRKQDKQLASAGFPHVYNIQGWTSIKPRAWDSIQVSHGGDRNTSLSHHLLYPECSSEGALTWEAVIEPGAANTSPSLVLFSFFTFLQTTVTLSFFTSAF